MKRLRGVLGIMISLFLVLICQVHAVEVAPRISDREIVERLTRLEEQFTRLEQGQKAILREMDVRFEAMDVRFEAMDMRFEAIDKRFDQLITVIVAIVMAFAGIVAVTIGFAIWDRRTMIRPFETKIKAMESQLSDVAVRVAKEYDAEKLNRLIGAMKKCAGSNKEIADALRSFNLL